MPGGRQLSPIRLIRMHGVAMCESVRQGQGYPNALPGIDFILGAALACHSYSVQVNRSGDLLSYGYSKSAVLCSAVLWLRSSLARRDGTPA